MLKRKEKKREREKRKKKQTKKHLHRRKAYNFNLKDDSRSEPRFPARDVVNQSLESMDGCVCMRSKHTKGSKERCLLEQNATCEFSG